jgi:omega-amidase
MKFTAAAVQFHPDYTDSQANLEKMETLLGVVVAERPDVRLVVMPELATTGYECGERFMELAEMATEAESVRRMAVQCKGHSIHLAYGFAERDADKSDVLYNSVALIDDQGQLGGIYRKVHLFAQEKRWFHPGSSYPVFETRLGRVGIFVCWDTLFPEPARILALKGADFLVVPTNWEKPYDHDWELAASARALDNTLHVIGANRFGRDRDYDFFGKSRIIDPQGAVLTSLDEEVEGYVAATIDTDETKRLRREYYTLLNDRRPETYEEITSQKNARAGNMSADEVHDG